MNKIMYYWHPVHGIYTGSLIEGARKATKAEIKDHEEKIALETKKAELSSRRQKLLEDYKFSEIIGDTEKMAEIREELIDLNKEAAS
jgi:hypothetical protein